MTTPVPVPSKAAIRALRGLVFGTTCSLALVLETRRRRISTVQTVIHNGQIIKSHERYRADAANATIRALEEEMLMHDSRPNYYADDGHCHSKSPSVLPWEAPESFSNGNSAPGDLNIRETNNDYERTKISTDRRDEPQETIRAKPLQTTYAESTNQWDLFANHTRTKEQLKKPLSRVYPRPLKALGSNVSQSIPPSTVASRIHSLCETGSKTDLEQASNILDVALALPKAELEPHLQEILESAAKLSRALQDVGSLPSAVKLIRAVHRMHKVNGLPFDEVFYWSYRPLPLVEFCMAEENPQCDLATELFAPKFLKKPEPTDSEVTLDILKSGEGLFTKLLARKSLRRMDKVLKRLKCYSCIPGGHKFELRILRQLVESGENVRAIEFFLTQASAVDCSRHYQSCYVEIGEMIFNCVSKLGGYKALSVLERLVQLRPQAGHLPVKWATQLLYLEWRAHGQLENLLEGFENLEEGRFQDNVRYPEAPYRVMIQIMLEAGDESGARHFFETKLVAKVPSAKTDSRINLLFAVARARAGEFATMHTMLEQISKSPWPDSADCAACLVPILQAFSEKHTMKQTEEFLRGLLNSFQISPSDYMMTFMAKLYGAVRDVKSLVGWIRFCLQSGLKLGPHYSNELLRNCHINWKFHFMELRKVYRLLQQLGPDSVDQVTANIMSKAALASTAVHRKGRISFAVPARQKPESRLAIPDRYTVAIEMEKSIGNSRPLKAVNLYRSATKMGMSHCPKCLRLFVVASLDHYGEDNIASTLDYLRRTQEATDVDTKGAFSDLLAWQIKRIDRTQGYEHVERRLRDMLQKMRAAKLAFGGSVLNSAAKLYADAGNHQGAIGLALMAAEEDGQVPGYCITNFTILLDAYIKTQQPDMIVRLVQAATSLGHWDKLAGRGSSLLKKLKQLRTTIQRVVLAESGNVMEGALDSLETAIMELKQSRRQHQEEQQELIGVVQDIMRAATLDAAGDSAWRPTCGSGQILAEDVTTTSVNGADNIFRGSGQADSAY